MDAYYQDDERFEEFDFDNWYESDNLYYDEEWPDESYYEDGWDDPDWQEDGWYWVGDDYEQYSPEGNKSEQHEDKSQQESETATSAAIPQESFAMKGKGSSGCSICGQQMAPCFGLPCRLELRLWQERKRILPEGLRQGLLILRKRFQLQRLRQGLRQEQELWQGKMVIPRQRQGKVKMVFEERLWTRQLLWLCRENSCQQLQRTSEALG